MMAPEVKRKLPDDSDMPTAAMGDAQAGGDAAPGTNGTTGEGDGKVKVSAQLPPSQHAATVSTPASSIAGAAAPVERPKKRRRTGKACASCRRRKTRCDGGSPCEACKIGEMCMSPPTPSGSSGETVVLTFGSMFL